MKKRIVFEIIGFLLVILLISLILGQNILYNTPLNIYSFGLIHFLGYLFFLLMPVEGIFVIYLFDEHNKFLLLTIAMITAILALMINYRLGHIVSKKNIAISKIMKPKKYQKFKRIINKHGNWIIFLFNLSIFSSPIIVFIAGILRLNFKNIMVYSFLGLFLKYLVIILFYSY